MMNRLLITASKTAAPSLRTNHTSTSSAVRFLSARQFSDSPAGDEDAAGVKVGTIKHFNFKGQFGFIIPDGVDKQNHKTEDLLFIHRNDIKVVSGPAGERFNPGLKRGLRVQFKTKAPDAGKESGRAYDLTLEGGDLVPPFMPGYLKNYIRTQKASFGDEVFDIFSTSQDQKELEMKIVEAYDKVKDNIERQKAKIQRAAELTGTKFDEEEA